MRSKPLDLFMAGDTMEAAIVEAFDEGVDYLRDEYGYAPFRRAIFVGPDYDVLYESALSVAGGRVEVEELPSGDEELKIERYLDNMFEDFEPTVAVRLFYNANPLIAVIITMREDEYEAKEYRLRASKALAEYFGFLYDGYAAIYYEE